MGLEPQHPGCNGWIDAGVSPPSGFLATAVDLAMVSAAQRDGELIADLAPQRPALGKSQVMGIRGLSAADQAMALGNRPNMISVPDPAGLGEGKCALVQRLRPAT